MERTRFTVLKTDSNFAIMRYHPELASPEYDAGAHRVTARNEDLEQLAEDFFNHLKDGVKIGENSVYEVDDQAVTIYSSKTGQIKVFYDFATTVPVEEGQGLNINDCTRIDDAEKEIFTSKLNTNLADYLVKD